MDEQDRLRAAKREGRARRARRAAWLAMVRITRRPLAAAHTLDIWDRIAEYSLEQADR